MLTTGFVKMRRGIHEHITDGKLTWTQAHIYIDLILLANPASGIWRGSAGYLEALFGEAKRTIKDALQRLEELGYIKRFMVPGSRHNYPILVNKYLVSLGVLTNKRLNATKTTDYSHPIYEDGPERVPLDVSDDVPLTARNNKRDLEKRELRKEKTRTKKQLLASLGPSPDFDAFWDAYPVKKKKQEARIAWENEVNGNAKEVIASIERLKPSRSWQEGYIPHPTTFLNQHRWTDEPDPPTAEEIRRQKLKADMERIANERT